MNNAIIQFISVLIKSTESENKIVKKTTAMTFDPDNIPYVTAETGRYK